MKKYYLIFGIIAVIVVVTIFTIYNRPEGDLGKNEEAMVLAPYVDAEATVSSLFLDDLHSDCKAPEVCPRDRVTLKIDKIDRTGDSNNVISLNVGDQTEFHLKYSARPAKLKSDILPTCGLGEVFEFRVPETTISPDPSVSGVQESSAGSAVSGYKSVTGSCIAEGCEGPECTASSPSYSEKPAETEGNHIVYHLPKRTDEVTEKILPGLEKDSKIKIRVWQPVLMSQEIGEYELVP